MNMTFRALLPKSLLIFNENKYSGFNNFLNLAEGVSRPLSVTYGTTVVSYKEDVFL